MLHDKEKYITILKIEIESLINDISSLIDYEKQLHDSNKHTNFVYLENLVVLKDEIMGLNGVLGIIENLEIDTTQSINKQLEEQIGKFIEHRGYPKAIYSLILSRMKKIEEIAGIY